MKLKHQIYAVDHHHGQSSRTVLGGYPHIRGATMREKAQYYLERLSWIHESLIREPRGHRNMLGSILTEPVEPGSAFGLLFLHAYGLFDGCGDSTFAAASAAIETGMVEPVEPITRFSIDTVLGPLHIEADVADGVVHQVRFENVPSYAVGDVRLEVPALGAVVLNIAFGGLYFGFIDAAAIGLPVSAEAEHKIIDAARRIFASASDGLELNDPLSGEPVPLDLITFVQREAKNTYVVANVYKPGRMGRTPSGTGTSAHIALRAALGEYQPGEIFIQKSIIGTEFVGSAEACELPGGGAGVRPVIGAKSYMMAISQFVIDASDPFARGFVLES